jgi:myo-inositol 2-dehydrogenase / D-chiro-inositol 1-dehydrogenase
MTPTPQRTVPATTDRRTFLATSATAAATTALGALAPSRFAHAAGSDAFKVGLIGCGRRGTGAVLECLGPNPDTVLWAAADIFPERVEQLIQAVTPRLQQQIQVAPERQFVGLDGYRGVIDTCDVVLVSVRAASSRTMRWRPSRRRSTSFSRRRPGSMWPVSRRFWRCTNCPNAWRQCRHRILLPVSPGAARGRPADPGRSDRRHRGDPVRLPAFPYYMLDRNPAWSELEYQLRNWSYFTWLGGDEIPKSLSHNIDSALWTLGDQLLPEAAYGVGGRSTHFEPRWGTSFDHHQVVYEFARAVPVRPVPQRGQLLQSNKDIYHGTKGRCHYRTFGAPYITDLKGNVVWQADEQSARIRPTNKSTSTCFTRSARASRCIRAKPWLTPPWPVCSVNWPCIPGKRLTWKELLESDFAYPPHESITWDTDPPVKPGPDGLYPIPIPGQSALQSIRG